MRNSSVNKNMRLVSRLVHITFRRGDENQDELQLTKHDKMEYSIPRQVSPQDQEVLANPIQGAPTHVITNVQTNIFLQYMHAYWCRFINSGTYERIRSQALIYL